MKDLTNRQQEIFDFLVEFVQDRGYPPSIRDITRQFGFRSPKAAADHLAALERKGFIQRTPELSRALSIRGHSASRDGRGARSAHEPRDPRTGRLRPAAVHLPLVGRIAAGQPLLAVENIEEVLTLDGGFVQEEGAFVLRVVGDSMIDAHIAEGDFIIVKPQDSAAAGEIVVALVGEEATVKRFFPEGDRVRLQPENARLAPIYVTRDDPEFRVVGRVVGLVRKMP
jgi:repressor LexA